MTTSPIIAVAAMLTALAVVVFAVRFVLRSSALAAGDGAADDPNTAGLAADDFGVPFTHLGVDVEPPCAPDWSSRAAAADPPKTAAGTHTRLALAHIDRATAILHDHVRREPSSIAAWLMLLELYRTHGREQALADLARDFSDRFHSQAAQGADAVYRGGADGGLEAFPPVMRLVTMLWGTHECRDLLARLQRDRGEGRRLGLSRAAYVDIATLAQLLDRLLAELEADRSEEAKVRAAWQAAAYVARVQGATGS